MPHKIVFLLALWAIGAAAAAAFARRLERMDAARVARGYLVAVAALMAVRVAAYVAANVFGATAVRPLSTGPYDLTNLLVGGVYGLAAVHARRGGFDELWRAPELLLALRLSAGIAFVLAGLVNLFLMDPAGGDFFVDVGYTKTFHLFIITAEVLGGAALLLPWRWLTLAAAAGLTIDMIGAIYTQARVGEPVNELGPAIAMLLRLAPLAVLCARGRWAAVGAGAAACAVVSVVGGTVLYHTPPRPVPAIDKLDYFLGTWHCTGTFASSGSAIKSDVRFERAPDGRWLVVQDGDRPPSGDHAPADAASAASGRQRFAYERIDASKFILTHEAERPDGWKAVDSRTCVR